MVFFFKEPLPEGVKVEFHSWEAKITVSNSGLRGRGRGRSRGQARGHLFGRGLAPAPENMPGPGPEKTFKLLLFF